MTCRTSAVAVCCSPASIKFTLERIALGGPLIKLGFALGKLALEIGDSLVGVG
jgi:hypothetical protein